MVSPGNTYAGLTKPAIGNDFGEPASFYPAGGRNYTRVVPSDDNEGRVAAGYMKQTLHATRIFVLNDRSDTTAASPRRPSRSRRSSWG